MFKFLLRAIIIVIPILIIAFMASVLHISKNKTTRPEVIKNYGNYMLRGSVLGFLGVVILAVLAIYALMHNL